MNHRNNLKQKCIDALNFLDDAGVLTYEQQEEIEISIMNLAINEIIKNNNEECGENS
jgi:uncharacterized protein Smg (DUF494 family)